MLIAYFSHSGNTKAAAEIIHEKAHGDIFAIATTHKYSDDYSTVVKQSRQELADNFRPELTSKVENFDSYDVIFVGFPNWCGTMPMAMFSFLEAYDFSGKTIVPFCTHEGSRLANSIGDIRKLCPNSSVLMGLAIRGSNVRNSQKEISEWLHDIGIIKESE